MGGLFNQLTRWTRLRRKGAAVAAVAAVDTPVAQPTAGPPKKLLQEQLEERINALVASHLRQLEVEIRAEIKNTLQAQRHRFFERSDPE